MTIKITNYQDNDILNVSLPLLIGEVVVTGDSKLYVQNFTFKSDIIVWPVINGKFKVLVKLHKGNNEIIINHKSLIFKLNLIYEPLRSKKFVRLVYIKCKDDEGFFQAPPEENNLISSACNRIKLAAQMLQTFTYDKFKEHNLPRKTFCLEEVNGDVVCHIFTSSLQLCDAMKLNEEQLWSHFAVELMNSNLRDKNNCKFLAFLSFTRYKNNNSMPPKTHREILQMTKGQVALGGGGLALFGSACLHTWSENLQEVPWRFGDKRKIDRMKFMDDSANRGYFWACYSTGLGATLHELGHTFDLGHTKGGIMGRGFDDIYKYFIVDMFYYDNLFQKEHNPYYIEPSALNYTVSLTPSSPISENSNVSIENIICRNEFQISEQSEETSLFRGEKPWHIPNPPDEYFNNPELAFNIGGAYWTRSSALILYFHKWFNDIECCNEYGISFNNLKLSSPYGIQIIEFRDSSGTLFHHLEFPENNGSLVVDLTLCDLIKYVPDDCINISFVAEDSKGNILKSKLKISELA